MAQVVHAPSDATFAQFYERTVHEPVYVILGVQGSGTNLLGRRLAKLFNFSVLRDGSMVFNAAARLGPSPARPQVEREIDAFLARTFPSALRRKTTRVLGDAKSLQGIQQELTVERVHSGADFARVIYAYRAFARGTTRMAIKSDDLWEQLHSIDQVIPKRRIVLLTRDFRDNLLSITGKRFGPVEPLCAARYVKDQLAHYAAEYRRAGRAGFHVKYESLLDSTREFVDEFARHFQIPATVDPDVAVPTLKFRPNKIGKWKRLSAQDLAWCEGILREELLEFGYPLASADPSLPGASQMAAAIARDKLRRIPQKIRRLVERIMR